MLRRFILQHRVWRQIRCHSSLKTPGLQLKPKPPPGIFGLYLRDNSEEYRTNNVYLSQNELIRLIGDAWKDLPHQERNGYREKYLDLVENYKQDLVEFEDQMDDNQRIVQTLKDEHEQTAIETQQASKPKAIEFPRRPTTAFAHFIKAAREAFPRDSTETVTEWNESMAQKWRDMNEEEKKRFREASKTSYTKFAMEKEEKETFSLDEVGGFQR